MGSLMTSHAMATMLRGFEEGSSLGPSLRKRSAASESDNPDGCGVDNRSAAEMEELGSSTIPGKTTDDKDARSMTDPEGVGIKQPELFRNLGEGGSYVGSSCLRMASF